MMGVSHDTKGQIIIHYIICTIFLYLNNEDNKKHLILILKSALHIQ